VAALRRRQRGLRARCRSPAVLAHPRPSPRNTFAEEHVRQVTAALDPYGADEAVVIVPDKESSSINLNSWDDDRIRLLEMHDLPDFFGSLLREE
jgi:hypothetical protein